MEGGGCPPPTFLPLQSPDPEEGLESAVPRGPFLSPLSDTKGWTARRRPLKDRQPRDSMLVSWAGGPGRHRDLGG